ncbi:MAG: 4-hydroxyphenylacetate 3-monooxygenase [Hyphomicrobiales bacterium]|nr:MAG: 4-hydroxyphenylacetate 3-monooxygenase [Hyphomicrobiales bacterium]
MRQVERTEAAVDRQTFRDAMSRYGGSVHVVTTDGPAGRAGITVTAACSVSDAPPTVLVCVNHGSPANATIKANGCFCINTLAAGAEPIADAFAGRGGLSVDARFGLGVWDVLETGAPVLSAARVAVDVRVDQVVEADTHSIIIGRVVDATLGDEGGALLHIDREYRTL